MGRDDWIGLRVARWRDIAGMTQQDLAGRVGVTREYISMIENGHKPVTKRSLLIALATALGVSVTDLTAQPYQPRSKDEMLIYAAAPAVRDALDEDPVDIRPLGLDVLAGQVERAMAARMACDYASLAATLPDLITQTRILANSAGPEVEAGLALFVRVAYTAAIALKPLGHVDLAMRIAERAQSAGELLGRPVESAAGEFSVAQCALAGGSRRRSLRVAVTAADRLGDLGGNDELAWYGMLHLHAALTAAALGRTEDAHAHLAEAESAAARTDGDPWRLEFGLANVAIWRVGVALENGEPERAPEYARRVDRAKIRTAQRRARLHMDTGRGLYLAGRPKDAVRQFLAADEVAPQEVRTRPQVREIVSQMVRDARRAGGHDELRTLAVRVGIDPLDPPEADPET